MSRLSRVCAGALVLAIVAGCEWESSSDEDSWNSAWNWVNFDGVYRPAAGRTYVVSAFAPQTTSPASTQNASQSLGTGNGAQANFNGTLGNTPVVAGSVTVTAGGQSLSDDASGNLSGNGTGSVNYNTGAITASFTLAPSAGQNVIASYQYSVPGSTPNPQPGSGQAIYSITVDQTGNVLAFTDSNGVTYSGSISGVSQGGGDSSGRTSGLVTATFSVSGSNGATISGTLQGDYTAPSVGTDGTSAGSGQLANRMMQGTYAQGGQTGDVQGVGGTTTITINTGTNAVVSVNN